jgi:type IV/VI secretion system ImpK/VasF family protein
MIAESLAANFIDHQSPGRQYPVDKGYYRSKLLVTDTFTNPLIAASSPLISILERIHLAQEVPPILSLQQDVAHEFKAFYSRFHNHDYSEEFQLLANYLLSATTDEILGKTYLRLNGEVQHFKAFTPISQSGIGPEEYFFEIINHLLSAPEQFLDLIELAYFCLLIGFEGKYHFQSDGRLHLENLIDNLFHTIQKYRSNKKFKLFKNYVLKSSTQKTQLSTKAWIGLAAGLVAGLIMMSQVVIEHQMTEILNQNIMYMENS